MKNIIPTFIQHQYKLSNKKGSFLATALFLDISGFTAMTEKLMKTGKHGPETLTSIINSLFKDLITIVYDKEETREENNFISLFAGDAFTAIFPDFNETKHSNLEALKVAIELQDYVREHASYETLEGTFNLSLKIGIAYGGVNWAILENTEAYVFYFRGPAIENCAQAEHFAQKNEIIVQKKILEDSNEKLMPFAQKLNNPNFVLLKDEEIFKESYDEKIKEQKEKQTKNKAIQGLKKAEKENILLAFTPQAVLETEPLGEFREICSVFISLTDTLANDPFSFDTFAYKIMFLCNQMGGYFNSLDFGDKGCIALVLFGAPIIHEDDRERASHFGLRVLEEFKNNVKISLSYGTAFCAFIGSEKRLAYTALGNVVNLSARLVMASPWGKFWTTEDVAQHLSHTEIFELTYQDEMSFKGFLKKLKVYQIDDSRERSYENFSLSNFFGREKELNYIQEVLNDKDIQHTSIAYIYGKPGIGKSRFLHEIYEKNQNEYNFYFLHPHYFNNKKFYSLIHFFLHSLNLLSDSQFLIENFESKINEIKESLLNKNKKKYSKICKKLESAKILLIESLDLDIITKKELSQIELTSAFTILLTTLLSIKKSVMVIEDLSGLDEETKKILSQTILSTFEEEVTFLVSSRYTDEGEYIKLIEEEYENQKEYTIELASLSDEAIKKMIENILAKKPSTDLFQFIKDRSEGNPFYIEHYCAYLQNEKMLFEKEASLCLKEESFALPNDINSLLVARIDRLPSQLREIVQITAVMGYFFNVSVLEMVSQKTSIELKSLLEAGSLELLWLPSEEKIYKFKDSLLAIAAYEMQSIQRRKELHLSIAESMQSLYKAYRIYDLEIAQHFEKAEKVEKMQQYYYNALSYYSEIYQIKQAIDCCDKLISYSRHSKEREALLERKINFLEISGKWADASVFLYALMEKQKEPLLKWNYILRLSQIFYKEANYDQSQEELLALLKEIESFKNNNSILSISSETSKEMKQGELTEETKAIVYNSQLYLALNYRVRGNYKEAKKYLDISLEKILSSENIEKRNKGMAFYYQAEISYEKRKIKKAFEYYSLSYDYFSEIGDTFYFCYPLLGLAKIYLDRGELTKSALYYKQCEKTFAKSDFLNAYLSVRLKSIKIEMLKGKIKETLSNYLEILQEIKKLNDPNLYIEVYLNLGIYYYFQNDFENTSLYFEKAFVIMKERRMRRYYGEIFSYLICLYAHNKKWMNAYKVAKQHFKIMRYMQNIDVSSGLGYLGVALVLKQENGKSKAFENILEELHHFSKIPNEEEAYFIEAIRIAKEAKHIHVILLCLYEYALYCQEINNIERGKAIWKRAREETERLGIKMYQNLLKQYAKKIDFDEK